MVIKLFCASDDQTYMKKKPLKWYPRWVQFDRLPFWAHLCGAHSLTGSQEASELSVTAPSWCHLYPPFWDLCRVYILVIYLPPAPRCQALSASTLPKACFLSFFFFLMQKPLNKRPQTMAESHHSWKEWSGKKDEILLNHRTCWHKKRPVRKA